MEPMNSADVKEYFDRVSAEWDDMRSSFYNKGVIDALAASTQTGSTMTVLDVGTGTGFVAVGLAPLAATVFGVDNSPAMLAVANNNFTALHVANATLIQAELDDLPLVSASVDASVANMVLHHAPNPANMLREMTRVTRPGGRVAITDAVAHSYEWMRTEQADIWLGFSEHEMAQFFSDAGLVEYGYASLGMQ